jgi:hypothetical protein
LNTEWYPNDSDAEHNATEEVFQKKKNIATKDNPQNISQYTHPSHSSEFSNKGSLRG